MCAVVSFWTFAVVLSCKLIICGGFQKKASMRSRVRRARLIRSALKSSDSAASNGGYSLLIRQFGADLITFEVVELSHSCGGFYQ